MQPSQETFANEFPIWYPFRISCDVFAWISVRLASSGVHHVRFSYQVRYEKFKGPGTSLNSRKVTDQSWKQLILNVERFVWNLEGPPSCDEQHNGCRSGILQICVTLEVFWNSPVQITLVMARCPPNEQPSVLSALILLRNALMGSTWYP